MIVSQHYTTTTNKHDDITTQRRRRRRRRRRQSNKQSVSRSFDDKNDNPKVYDKKKKFISRFSFSYFGCSLSSNDIAEEFAQSKVCDANLRVFLHRVEENVLWLDIQVQNVVLVQRLQAGHQVSDDTGGVVLGEVSSSDNVLVQLAASA